MLKGFGQVKCWLYQERNIGLSACFGVIARCFFYDNLHSTDI